MRRHGDSEKNNCSQCLLFINDSLLWFIHVESSVEFLKGTMLYSCAIFFDSFSAMCFMFFFLTFIAPLTSECLTSFQFGQDDADSEDIRQREDGCEV